ncbi:unnamed protein product [Boreogadus saida]
MQGLPFIVEFLVVPSNEDGDGWRVLAGGPTRGDQSPWLETKRPSARHLLTKTNQLNHHQNGESSPSLFHLLSNVLQDIPTDFALTHFVGRKRLPVT